MIEIELHWPYTEPRSEARQYKPIPVDVPVLPRPGDWFLVDDEEYPVERIVYVSSQDGACTVRAMMGLTGKP